MAGNISDQGIITSAITPTAGVAGVTDITGATLDMTGFDGVLMVVRFGAIVAGAVTSIKAQQGNAANMSDAADLAGTGQTVVQADADGLFYIDICRPQKRYLRLIVKRGTANATVASGFYLQYGASKLGVTPIIKGEAWLSPAEGAA